MNIESELADFLRQRALRKFSSDEIVCAFLSGSVVEGLAKVLSDFEVCVAFDGGNPSDEKRPKSRRPAASSSSPSSA